MTLHTEKLRTIPAPPAPPSQPETPLYVYTPFWRRQWVLEAVPFATSLAFHAALIIIGIIVIQKVPVMLKTTQEQNIIPEATIIEGQEVGGLPNPGLGGDPNLAAAQSVDPNVNTSDGTWERKSETLSQTLVGGGAGAEASDSVIGLGLNANMGGTAMAAGIPMAREPARAGACSRNLVCPVAEWGWAHDRRSWESPATPGKSRTSAMPPARCSTSSPRSSSSFAKRSMCFVRRRRSASSSSPTPTAVRNHSGRRFFRDAGDQAQRLQISRFDQHVRQYRSDPGAGSGVQTKTAIDLLPD